MLETRKYFLISLIIIFLIALGSLYISNVNNNNTNKPVGGKDRPYYFRIELTQWTMKLIDLNRIEDLMLEGYSHSAALSEATYIDIIGKLEKGSQVYFQIYSLDVQHGVSINELNINISILEPTADIASTIPYFYEFYLPESDTSFTAYCQVYCGLGHSNMKLRFEVGAGETRYGNTLFNLFVILIVTMASIFLYLIASPIKKKVYLLQKTSPSTQLVNTSQMHFYLYDVSKLSEKELIALRQGYLDVEKRADLIEVLVNQKIDDVRTELLSNDFTRNYDLIN